jgi:hypothetical protein
MTYQPNFTDRRVVARIRHAYGWTRGVMSTSKSTSWSQSQINRYLGHQTDNLGKYLREVLLVTTNHHYSKDTGETKQYLLNQIGLDYLFLQLTNPNKSLSFASFGSKNIDNNNTSTQYPSVRLPKDRHQFDIELVTALVRREYSNELTNLSFQYTDKSNRLWHPIQNIKREFKSKILTEHGLPYHYDINCCAPTLIMRRAHQLGMETWPRAIGEYIERRDELRQELAKHIDIQDRDMKVIVNALFCGARIGNNPQFSIYQLLGDRDRVELLRNHPFIIELRTDIKECWSYITQSIPRRSITDKNGNQRMLPVSSKQKWSVYFDLERQVLNSVRDYLTGTNNRHFLEHDGWSTQNKVEQQELHNHIFTKTGLLVTTQLNTLV